MLGKDVSKQTDWSDSLREDSPIEPRLSQATTYGYKTRSNVTLFKFGVTDVSSEDSQDAAINQYVGDSVDTRCVRQFIDYSTFSNPFIKYKQRKAKVFKSETTDDKKKRPALGIYKIDGKSGLTESCRSIADQPKPLFVSHSMLLGDSPIDEPEETIGANPEKKSESEPTPKVDLPTDDKIIIEHGTYYMHDMFKAVNNEPDIKDSLSAALKNHVVQNHQNLHEVLEARKKEKPLATPHPINLPQSLGSFTLFRQDQTASYS